VTHEGSSSSSSSASSSPRETPRDQQQHQQLLSVLKCLGLLVRLALASRNCAAQLRHSQSHQSGTEVAVAAEEEQRQFVRQMDQLRSGLILLLGSAVRRKRGQNAVMEHLPALILPLLEHSIYEPVELAKCDLFSIYVYFNKISIKRCPPQYHHLHLQHSSYLLPYI
jgi:hypothetical protein